MTVVQERPGIRDRLRSSRLGHLGLFGATVVLNGAISLVSIPIIVALAGAGPWASMATGQSIGSFFAVIVEFGWGLTGPAAIAMAEHGRRPSLFLDSLLARLVLVLPLFAVQALVTVAIVPHAKIVALTAGTAMLLAGVSASWYFAGESRPDRFLFLDTVPRVSGTVLGLFLAVTTGELLLFAIGQLIGSVVALVISAFAVLRRTGLDARAAAHRSRIASSLLSQRRGLLATGLSAAFTPAVLGIVAIGSPALLPVFVLADRLTRFTGMALSPIYRVFQGWVPAARGAELLGRIRLSGAITLAASGLAGLVYAVGLPLLGGLLTHGQVLFDAPTAIAFGIIAAIQIGSPFLTNVALIAVGRLRFIAVTLTVGVPLSLGALVITELLRTEQYAVWAFVLSSALVLVWQLFALRSAMRELGDSTASGAPESTAESP